jgi:mannose-6-phosphate isomerase
MSGAELSQRLFLLEPQYRERVWGGQRIERSDPPIGEAWLAFEDSRVRDGKHAGQTLAELAKTYPHALLGTRVADRFGTRFPLLAKILDCADWLSIQLHPDDAQAKTMVGPEAFGKTEAWHFLDVDQGARIIAGVKPGVTRAFLCEAIRAGKIKDVVQDFAVQAGETYLLPAGTMHALGPGLLVYEVQQSSDTTYRVYDWDRPAKAGRALHIEQSVAVADPARLPKLTSPEELLGTSVARAASCRYFELDVVQIGDRPFSSDTGGQSFEILTPVDGSLVVSCDEENIRLSGYASALVAGSAGKYEIEAVGGTARVLRASVPQDQWSADCV